jgi:membrane associated rhomboid family serine protease
MSESSKRIFSAFFIPAVLLIAIWLVKLIEYFLGFDFSDLGIYPRKLEGIVGIVLSPFIHSDFNHLMANSIPLFVLSATIITFYNEIAYKLLWLIPLITGFWVWVAARESYHIGASGVIYGLASFIFTSGIIRKYYKLMAISLAIVFLYGGMIWGIFPLIKGVSWESHLFGMIAGLALAIYYKSEGPQRPKYEWEDEEDDEETNQIVSDEPEKVIN